MFFLFTAILSSQCYNINIFAFSIIIVMSKMVDDAQKETRQPSHYDIELEINKAGLIHIDPNKKGTPVGKAKRVRAVLNWAIENDFAAGQRLVKYLINLLRGVGGFRPESPNYIGREEIENAVNAFKNEGLALGSDGVITPIIINDLPFAEQEKALRTYIQRAQKGAEDSALLVGTSKDLLEAVSAYIIHVKIGSYPTTVNFPTLLGQAFTMLGLSTPNDKVLPGESPQKRMERAFYETACAINQLRNKQGTGHGRPFSSTVTTFEAEAAIRTMGTIVEYMLSKL